MTCAVVPDKDELEKLAVRGAVDLEDATALEILQWADDTLGDTWCVTSSMADALVPHLASRVHPGIDVVFLDTGYHFAETLGTRDAVAATMPVTVRTITPRQSVEEQDRSFGKRLYERNPDQCCIIKFLASLNKVGQ